jgi:hypothetical protein
VPSLPPGPDSDIELNLVARWLPGLNLQLVPRIFVPVGTCIPGGETVAGRAKAVLASIGNFLRGRGMAQLWSPAELATMHAIDPKSHYYQLVCGGDPPCDHL